MPFATVNDGLSLYFEEHGQGEPLVWIAGTGHSGRVWTKFQLPAFAERYRCITVDLRGCGQSDVPPGQYTMAMMAADIAGLMGHLSLESAHFVGFSMGSAILQELALAAPQMVRSAVMWGTWSCTPIEHHIRRHFEARLIALEQAPFEVFRAASFWAWAPSFVEREPTRMAALEEFIKQVSSVPLDAWANHFRADLMHDTLSRLPQIKCPTLVLHGAEDLITLPSHNERVAAAVANAELRSITGAGHMAFVERPQECNEAIRDFLDRVTTTAPLLRPAGGRVTVTLRPATGEGST